MEYKCLSDFLFKGENKNINISVSKNSPVNASLSFVRARQKSPIRGQLN